VTKATDRLQGRRARDGEYYALGEQLPSQISYYPQKAKKQAKE